MEIKKLVEIIDGTVINKNADLSRVVIGACGADLMSDVLASAQPEAVLLTGLCNPQVVRTASMADVSAIVLVRGKIPPHDTVTLAMKERIPLISSPYGMFELCGRLYKAGIISFESPVQDNQGV